MTPPDPIGDGNEMLPSRCIVRNLASSRLLHALCGHLVRVGGAPSATRLIRMCPTCEAAVWRRAKVLKGAVS